MLFVCHPKILHKHCFQFLLGPFSLPRENEDNAWVAFKRQSSMKFPCGILCKGVLEPLTHVCTDLKISKESNVLIQVIVM